MNGLTVAAFGLALLYAAGAAVYVWRIRGRLHRRSARWRAWLALFGLAGYGAFLGAGAWLFHDDPLSASGLWAILLLAVLSTTSQLMSTVEATKPLDPALLRYPYRPTRDDQRLIVLALTLPGLALLAVLAVLLAHAIGAFA